MCVFISYDIKMTFFRLFELDIEYFSTPTPYFYVIFWWFIEHNFLNFQYIFMKLLLKVSRDKDKSQKMSDSRPMVSEGWIRKIELAIICIFMYQLL